MPGTLDVLVCCAGVQGEAGPTMELDPEEWKRTIAVNLDGTFFAIRAFYPRLRATDRRAKIVCFSGGGATSPRPNFSAYAVAKTGVVRLVENLAAEWNGVPIDINAIAPGAINTAMTEETLAAGPGKVGAEEYAKTLRQKETGGGSMQKVIDLVKFLISPESDGISGRLLAAQWDPFRSLPTDSKVLGDVFTLRRIVPEDRDLALPAQP